MKVSPGNVILAEDTVGIKDIFMPVAVESIDEDGVWYINFRLINLVNANRWSEGLVVEAVHEHEFELEDVAKDFESLYSVIAVYDNIDEIIL